MYDLKNEAHEFTGADRADAVDKACQFFDVESAALDIMSFADGAVYGLASRSLIVAAPKGRATAARSDDADRSERGPRGRGRDRDRGRGRDRDRDRDRGREERGGRRDREERGRGDRSERSDTRSATPAPTPAHTPSGPSVGTISGEIGEVTQFVLGVIERMELGPFEISEGSENELIVVEVKGEATKALAGKEARAVDALQLLANQASGLTGLDHPRVVIDIEGNEDAREEFLTKLADRVAKRALQTGRPVALEPMNGRDRRSIHIALRDREDVATMSEGEGRYRQVVVVPEGADEFDEAAAQSEEP